MPGKQEEQGAVARKDDRGVLVGGERAAGRSRMSAPPAPMTPGSVQPGKGRAVPCRRGPR
ncbi:MAG: hypothetical protein ACLR0N_14205 [Bilophila wadsworthia]